MCNKNIHTHLCFCNCNGFVPLVQLLVHFNCLVNMTLFKQDIFCCLKVFVENSKFGSNHKMMSSISSLNKSRKTKIIHCTALQNITISIFFLALFFKSLLKRASLSLNLTKKQGRKSSRKLPKKLRKY